MVYRLALLLCMFFAADFASAATLYLDPPRPTLNRGDSVTLSVRLDTDEATDECINAIDGVITYNEAINPVDISIGQSIFPIWVEQPVIDKDSRTITFAGGIPNGYCGRVEGDPRLTNTLLQIVFRAPGLTVGGTDVPALGTVTFKPETRAFLNDGFGTEAQLQTLGAELILNQVVGSTIVDDWRDVITADNIPPEEFSITLEKDEFAFDKKYYIVFNTTDKQSGISHYEVIEEPVEDTRLFTFGAATTVWTETRSPYVLNDQSLKSTIRVRAVDKAGNEYIATLAPKNASLERWPLWMIASGGSAVVALVVLTLLIWYWRRRRKTKCAATVPEAADITDIV
ncbi:MAG: hypothetical protein ACK4SL_01845 [Candidatus Paceibacteria bacterium]